MLRRCLLLKLKRMTTRYEVADLAAETWKNEVEDLASKVKDEDGQG